LYELDQLAKRLGHPLQERLERLEKHRDRLNDRDDLRLEWVTLLNSVGRSEEALEALLSYEWRPWEGGEGKAPAQYEAALTAMANARLADERPAEALELIEQASEWPDCLGEGKLWPTPDCRIVYLKGVALAACNRNEDAKQAFAEAASGRAELGDPAYYNDLPPDTVFYQGLSLHAAGQGDEAVERFNSLVEYGQSHIDDEIVVDFFAVSLPDFLVFDDDLNERNRQHCLYVMALGKLGLAIAGKAEFEAAEQLLDQLLAAAPDHLGALTHRRLIGPTGALHQTA
ncbi:MAG: DUF5107 domain-containing protein, partial [Planctomycetota bacterium]